MSEIPLKARAYIIGMIISAVGIVPLLYYYVEPAVNTSLVDLFVFFIATLIAELLPVKLPHGTKVSVGLAIWFANIILFTPFEATVITSAAFGVAMIFDEDQNIVKTSFNIAQTVITIAVSSILLHQILMIVPERGAAYILSLIAVMLFCSILNLFFVIIVVSLVTNVTFMRIWKTNHRWEISNIVVLIPLGFLISMVYKVTGVTGVLLFLVPLLIARRSFQLYIDMRRAYMETVESLANTIDAKDRYTRGHSDRVARYSIALAGQLGLPDDRIEIIKSLALLHDTGKVGVNESILNKPGRLDDDEFAMMKKHSEVGAQIVKGITFLKDGHETIKHHHERWDGRGYPSGLVGKETPLGARIIAVADAFDAMSSDRPYRNAMTPQQAYDEIVSGSGSQFDPQVVEAFRTVYPDLVEVIQEKTRQDTSLLAEQDEIAEEINDMDESGESKEDIKDDDMVEGDVGNVY